MQSPSSHETLLRDFSLENGKCTCVADADKTCMHCAVKEYQEALQKVRDYSIKCAMPKIKNTRKGRKRFYQNYARDSKQSDVCNNNVEPSKSGSAELQHDQICNTEDSLSHTNANSILRPTQSNNTTLQSSLNCQTGLKLSDANFQQAEDSTTNIALPQSLQTQNCHTSDTETCHDRSQFGTELIKNEPCDINSESDNVMSESSQDVTSRSESFERSDEACDYESDHSNSSANLQEYKDFKPKISLDIKTEPREDNDSDSVETQNTVTDCHQNQSNPPDSPVEKNLNIRTKLCDIDSNSKEAEGFHLYYQPGNELHIKSEPCDMDSNSETDPLTSESSQKIKSYSESFKCSDEACDQEIDHSNNSSVVEMNGAKPSDENHDDSPPNQDLKRSRRSK